MVLNNKRAENRNKILFSEETIDDLVVVIKSVTNIEGLNEIRSIIADSKKEVSLDIQKVTRAMKILDSCLEEQYRLIESVN